MMWSFKQFLSKEKTADDYLPKYVRIDACTRCQLHCKCCDLRAFYTENNEKSGYLTFQNFKKFVKKNKFVELIELSNNGEIFLNPELLDIIKFAAKKKVRLIAYNGVNLNAVSDEMLEALVKYKFRGLTISIDGASPETYQEYRVGGDFNKVIENIKKINYFKEKYNSIYPHLKYQFVLFGHNEHEIPQAKLLAQKLNMEISFKINWDDTFSPVIDNDFVAKETQFKNFTASSLSDNEIQAEYFGVCHQLWFEPQINWDGTLLGCCVPHNADYNVNVFEVGLRKALNTKSYLGAKKLLMHEVKDDGATLCSNCYYFNLRNMKNSWITKKTLKSAEKYITEKIAKDFID